MEWDEYGPTEAEMEAATEECHDAQERQTAGVKSAILDNTCGCWERLGHRMVSRVVVIAEVVDEVGDRNFYTLHDPDMPVWDVLGMLTYASGELA